ncbi:MAG: hypothetical protein Q4G47_04700, partial [Lachnospiraceae bacterium]|nr:hypothetical protein [Lachnospiraceae bacterium]
MITQTLALAAVIAAASVMPGVNALPADTVSAAEVSDEAVNPVDPAVIAKYEGDWVGALRVESISIPFLDWVGKTWDVAARFSFEEDGKLNLFLRTQFPDWEFDFRDISAELDPWLEDVFVDGKFLGFPMKQPAILSLTYTFDGSMVLNTVLEADESGSADLSMTLRRIGDGWTGEEEPGID